MEEEFTMRELDDPVVLAVLAAVGIEPDRPTLANDGGLAEVDMLSLLANEGGGAMITLRSSEVRDETLRDSTSSGLRDCVSSEDLEDAEIDIGTEAYADRVAVV